MFYGFKTELSPQEILDRARTYFGSMTNGLGLEILKEEGDTIYFRGGGGHVTLTVTRGETGMTDVQIDTREWDTPVRQFMRSSQGD